MLGARFEAEIREQPAAWRRVADSDAAVRLATALAGRDVLFLGSGSSLGVGMLGALALRRRGVRAWALAATEARFDRAAYREACVVALSQSGRSTDLLAALDLLAPAPVVVALTNDLDSPLAARADVAIDVQAGPEVAVPASKSVTTTAAIVLWAAALAGGATHRNATSLRATADDVAAWLAAGEGVAAIAAAGADLAGRRALAVVGAGYGVPIAYEVALKIKESSYVHAEGFAAGEFRHGSSAILDASSAIVGIVDDPSRAVVARPLEEALAGGAARYVIGAPCGAVPLLGPQTAEPFNTLAWLVAGQLLALQIGRANGVDSDAPRGLRKFVL